VPICVESDIVSARRAVREAATHAGFGTTDVTRLVTAASELARNIYKYAGTGNMIWREIRSGELHGIEIRFVDSGPGIVDLEAAMVAGYSTTDGLGMGLPGAKRLTDEMEVTTAPGKGTSITVRKWLGASGS